MILSLLQDVIDVYVFRVRSKSFCLMEVNALMRDDIIVTDRGVYESKESLQTICTVVLRKSGCINYGTRLQRIAGG